MKPDDLKSLYLTELQEACSFEAQIAQALPDLADKATAPALCDFLLQDMPAARLHGRRLCGLLEIHGVADEHHADGSMQAILREAVDWADTIADPEVRDTALIASLQRVLHYGIAVHGSLADWAQHLGLEDHRILATALEDTRRADRRLTEIAQRNVTRKAA